MFDPIYIGDKGRWTVGLPWFDWHDGKREGWCAVSTAGRSPSNSIMLIFY